MAERLKLRKVVFGAAGLVLLVVLAYMGRGWFYGARTIHELLTENKQLKGAITNLTQEEQIGYAKVISQEHQEGKLFSTIKFVETARDDPLKKVLEKEYTIEGDIIHFDALIVKFGGKMVMDGKKKSLYLWRRVYGEKTAPDDGMVIEEAGKEPQRYGDLLKLLSVREREMFWTNIWELANEPEKLKGYDIEAIYGNVVYSKLKRGFIYVFKITPSGQLYPETVPAM